jgi:hypothetical protein
LQLQTSRLLAKGALHIHSTFSGDGEASLHEIKDIFMKDGFDFVAICEHQHDVDSAQFEQLVQECRRLSDHRFLMIPGIEFNCYRNHILGIGISQYCPSIAEDEVVPWIKSHNGFAVWAHPRKNHYRLPEHVVKDLDGMEIWNSKCDGKYAPQKEVVDFYHRRRVECPQIRAICSVDFHFLAQFRHLAVYCEVTNLSMQAILASLMTGRYSSGTTAFAISSDGTIDIGAPGTRNLANRVNMWIFDRFKRLYRQMKRRHIPLPSALKTFGRRLFS